MVKPNRRQFPRQSQHASAQISMAPKASNKPEDKRDLIPATICNQSREGICIEVGRALTPGLNISIRMISSERHQPQDAYYTRDGLVIWCKKFADKMPRFGVGVKILRKVVQADVLTSRFDRDAGV